MTAAHTMVADITHGDMTGSAMTDGVTPALIAAAAPAAPRPLILAADDSPLVRLYYRQILEAEAFEMVEAVNGMEALELTLRMDFALCIIDLNMPVMDGYSFLRALRRREVAADLPVLMISVEAEASDRRQALAAGANAYLVKPAPRPLLRSYVAAMIGIAA